METLLGYFDLQAERRSEAPAGQAEGASFPIIPQYIALVAGIVVQPFFHNFQETGQWGLSSGFFGWLVFSVISGIVIFPAVYKGALDPGKPMMVQLCTVFASGIGWQALLRTAGAAAQLAPPS